MIRIFVLAGVFFSGTALAQKGESYDRLVAAYSALDTYCDSGTHRRLDRDGTVNDSHEFERCLHRGRGIAGIWALQRGMALITLLPIIAVFFVSGIFCRPRPRLSEAGSAA